MEGEDLLDSISYFTDPNANTIVRGNLRLQCALDAIEKHAEEHGLDSENITSLLGIAASGRFADSTSSRLVRSLIPKTTVPEEAVVNAVSWVCTNKPSISIQRLLIRWIILVYDYIDSKESLHALYGIIFHFIQSEALCPYVCHLLYLLTRKQDVRLFRVRQLLQLQQRMGAQPYIIALLEMYKVFCPHMVTVVVPRTKKVLFPQRDKKWAAAIKKVQGEKENHEDDELLPEKQPQKRRKIEVIPDVHRQMTDEFDPVTFSPALREMVPFQQIKSFTDLHKLIDCIELPSQLLACLRYPLLQMFLSCRPEETVPLRLQLCLRHTLYEELMYKTKGDSYEAVDELLKFTFHFTELLQESIPVVVSFLKSFLYRWNGFDHQPVILQLLTHLRLCPFDELHDLVLDPLNKLFFTSDLYTKCAIICCITKMLQNILAVEMPNYVRCLDHQKQRADVQQSYTDENNFINLFEEEVEVLDPYQIITSLVQYVDKMLLVGLQVESNHSLLLHQALSFYELVCSMDKLYEVPLVIMPHSGVLYRILFSHDVTVISRACSLLCEYKVSFRREGIVTQKQQLIPQLNSLILDFSDSLWRSKAFRSGESDTLYQHFDAEEVQAAGVENIHQIFSIFQHHALLPFAYIFLKLTQPENRNVHPQSLKRVQDTYMDWLHEESVGGIPEFVATFIKRKK